MNLRWSLYNFTSLYLVYQTKYSNCLEMDHINVNSVQHKFNPLPEALKGNLLDALFVQKTMLDDTFPQAQFGVTKQYIDKIIDPMKVSLEMTLLTIAVVVLKSMMASMVESRLWS